VGISFLVLAVVVTIRRSGDFEFIFVERDGFSVGPGQHVHERTCGVVLA
jgi:hypothetical protein